MKGESGQLIEAWIKRYEIIGKYGPNADRAKELFWAFEEVDSACMHMPEHGLQLINYILASTKNEFVLTNLAAGPLETLLARHGKSVINELERCAKRDARFRALLRGVWQNQIDDQTWARVLKAAKD
jgi:Family of unknown function (DUF6869)